MTSPDDPAARSLFRDLPASAFPLLMELFDGETGEVAWSAEITGPGAVQVPSWREVHHRPLRARVRFGDGTEETSP